MWPNDLTKNGILFGLRAHLFSDEMTEQMSCILYNGYGDFSNVRLRNAEWVFNHKRRRKIFFHLAALHFSPPAGLFFRSTSGYLPRLLPLPPPGAPPSWRPVVAAAGSRPPSRTCWRKRTAPVVQETAARGGKGGGGESSQKIDQSKRFCCK